MAKIRARELFNGDLVYPKRGSPPVPPEGFEPDKGDPYLLHRVYKKCAHRYVHEQRLPCCPGVVKYTYFCDTDDFVTNYIRCNKCEVAI